MSSPTMAAAILNPPGTLGDLVVASAPRPRLGLGEVLVEVRAAAITRDELGWPADRLPAIPSHELSGVLIEVAPNAGTVVVGEPVFALTPFDRNGVAAEFASVPADLLASKPRTLGHVEAAALPLAALSAWQGLFDHGELEAGQRVLIHGSLGGVGHLAAQLARRCGAHVIGSRSPGGPDPGAGLGAHEYVDGTDADLAARLDPVDLVFDTVGGEQLERLPALIRSGGRLVSVAEEPPRAPGIRTTYFVVEPNRDQLRGICRLADAGELRPAIDSVFPLVEAQTAFARCQERGKRGKVVIRVSEEMNDA